MDEGDFYEEDETPEEIAKAWESGEHGVTSGPRRLKVVSTSTLSHTFCRTVLFGFSEPQREAD